MSARCPEGHLSHDTHYCDRCGLPMDGAGESYGHRGDEYPDRPVSQGQGAHAQPYAGDPYGRRGYGEPTAAPDPLGIRRVPADTRGVADPPRGYAPERQGRSGSGGYPPGYGRDGYAGDPPAAAAPQAPHPPAPDAYDNDPYGRDTPPRGRARDARDARDYGQDDPYGGTMPRGRENRGGYGHENRDGYGRAGRDDDMDHLAHRPADPYGYAAPPEAPSAARPAPPQAPNAPEAGGRYAQCPNCHTLHESGVRYCETCGMDFATGHAPSSAGAVPFAPAAPGPAPHTDDRMDAYDDAHRGPGRSQEDWETAGAATWEAVVEAEREYYDSGDDHRVPFPAFYPRRVFALDSPRLLVGRRSESRGIHPEIDLSGAPEDPGISRAHAIFEQMPDGTYAVLDPGSTNGTRLNDDPEPIDSGQAVPLRDGDRVYLGAWTRVTIRAR